MIKNNPRRLLYAMLSISLLVILLMIVLFLKNKPSNYSSNQNEQMGNYSEYSYTSMQNSPVEVAKQSIEFNKAQSVKNVFWGSIDLFEYAKIVKPSVGILQYHENDKPLVDGKGHVLIIEGDFQPPGAIETQRGGVFAFYEDINQPPKTGEFLVTKYEFDPILKNFKQAAKLEKLAVLQ